VISRLHTSGGRCALMAAVSCWPSGSASKAAKSTSIFIPTTVATECTLLSVRLLRDQATCEAGGDADTR
jgi:hypothetical protein